MKRQYFINLEQRDAQRLALSEVIDQLAFDDAGLIPVITQDAKTKSMLMFAWMNRAALQQTISTKRMTYWSRSRQQLWVKGETSGHSQRLIAMVMPFYVKLSSKGPLVIPGENRAFICTLRTIHRTFILMHESKR